MPKSTHHYQAHDAMSTDNKSNPDERILAKDKQQFQASEKGKQQDARTEKDFVADQDKQNSDQEEQSDE